MSPDCVRAAHNPTSPDSRIFSHPPGSGATTANPHGCRHFARSCVRSLSRCPIRRRAQACRPGLVAVWLSFQREVPQGIRSWLWVGFGIYRLARSCTAASASWVCCSSPWRERRFGWWGSSSRRDTWRGVVEPKVAAGNHIKYAAADLNGWQTGYVLDHGASRVTFEEANAYLAALRGLRQTNRSRGSGGRCKDRVGIQRIHEAGHATWAAVQAQDYARAERLTLGPDTTAYNHLAAAAGSFVAQANQDRFRPRTRSPRPSRPARWSWEPCRWLHLYWLA